MSFSGGKGKSSPISIATQAGLEDGFDKASDMMEGVSRNWTATLESNFNEFWDSTFGYANSLLEQLLKMTFTGILSQALSFLPGGGILTGIISAFSSPTSSGGGVYPQTIVVKLGDEDLATAVRKGDSYNTMRRRN